MRRLLSVVLVSCLSTAFAEESIQLLAQGDQAYFINSALIARQGAPMTHSFSELCGQLKAMEAQGYTCIPSAWGKAEVDEGQSLAYDRAIAAATAWDNQCPRPVKTGVGMIEVNALPGDRYGGIRVGCYKK